MEKRVLIAQYWGLKAGTIIYADKSEGFAQCIVGVYDCNRKFIVYTFDLEELEKCTKLI